MVFGTNKNMSKTQILLKHRESYSTEIYLLSFLVFLLNPVLGVFSLFHVLISNFKINKEKLFNLFVFLLAIFLTFINITKIPENDLHFHGLQYLLAKEVEFFEYLTRIGKEPIGYAFNYIMYYLTGGSVKIWVLTFSFISYFLFFKAIQKFFLYIKAPKSLLILGLILGAFFPQLFSLSAHLIRQFIASSIFIYFAVDKIFYKKNRWWLVVIGVLTHSSSIILYALVFFKFLGNFKKYKFLNFALLFVLIFYQNIARLLKGFLGGINGTLDYILKRTSQDTTFDFGEFQLMNFILMFIMILVVVTSKQITGKMYEDKMKLLFNKIGIDVCSKRKEVEKNLRFFFSIMIMLSVFILINIKQSELSNRLFFYVFFYFPFVIPLALLRFKQKGLISYCLSILFIVYFIYRLENGVWTYASLRELVSNSVYGFLTYPEPIFDKSKYYWNW